MAKSDVNDAGDRKKFQAKESATTDKVAGESISDDPMAAAYEPRFKSFSGIKAGHLGASVSEFCIEDAINGKLITAQGERSTSGPRLSFVQGLKQVLHGDHSPEETARLQAEFSIAYMTRKASQFFQQTAGALIDGIQHCFASPQDSRHASAETLPQQSANVFDDQQPVDKDTATGEETIAKGRSAHGALDIIAQTPSQQSDAPHQPSEAPVFPGFKFLDQINVKPVKDYVESWERSGSVHEIPSIGKALLDTSKTILDDPKRNVGEFNFAIGEKDGKLYESSLWYNPGVKIGPYEMQETVSVNELKNEHIKPIMFEHSHPYRKGMGYDIFSGPDLATAQKFDGDIHLTRFSGSGTFKEFLLTPAPENKLLMYAADYNDKALTHQDAEKEGRIVELGHFSADKTFVPNQEQSKLLKELGLIK